MSSKLAAIRAKLAEKNNKAQSTPVSGDNGLTFKFWDMEDGKQSTVRFLEDGNSDNTFFWVERNMIKLPFSGVIGGDEHTEVHVTVPCVEMFQKNTCPIIAEIKPWWKAGEEYEALARKYYLKRMYIMQGFVVNSSLQEEITPENPIRRFNLTPQLYKLIEACLQDPEIHESVTDIERGLDFTIAKNKVGAHSSYTTSKWSRYERALNEAERAAIAQYGLVDLSTYLPKKPDAEALAAIYEMFQDSVDGKPYDPARFGNFYRPYGVEAPSNERKDTFTDNRRVVPPVTAPVVTPAVTPSVQQAQSEPLVQEAPQQPNLAGNSTAGVHQSRATALLERARAKMNAAQ